MFSDIPSLTQHCLKLWKCMEVYEDGVSLIAHIETLVSVWSGPFSQIYHAFRHVEMLYKKWQGWSPSWSPAAVFCLGGFERWSKLIRLKWLSSCVGNTTCGGKNSWEVVTSDHCGQNTAKQQEQTIYSFTSVRLAGVFRSKSESNDLGSCRWLYNKVTKQPCWF